LTWKTKKSYRFTKIAKWFSTSTVKYYIPLTGNVAENATASSPDVNLNPSNSGKLVSINFISDATPGTTILTLEDEIAGTLGTVSFTYNGSGALTTLNFPADFDTGTGEFNGLGRIRIGLDVAASAGVGVSTVTFEIDL